VPSKEHELPLEMFRNRPQLAPQLLRTAFGIPIPDSDKVSLGSESYSESNPAEFRCDATVLVGDPNSPDLGIVVEVQLQHSKRKIYSWPAYLALLRARCECPVTLLVLCPDEATARACEAPIHLGHRGWVLEPLVLSPARLPAVTDLEKARELPELAVLSTPAHADGPHAEAVIQSFCAAIGAVARDDADIGALYHDYVELRLSIAARKLLEETMKLDKYQWQGEFALRHIAEGEAKGKAEGEARAVLLFLAARGIEISDQARERITSCTVLDRLELWVRRAATVDTAEQLFD
jgi:hypothetical protein